MCALPICGKDAINHAIQGWQQGQQQGGTQGQQKIGANQGTGGKWPTTDAEIRAFQTAHGLKNDGLIGQQTMAALQKAGIKPPAGFHPVANRQHAGGQHPAAHPWQNGCSRRGPTY